MKTENTIRHKLQQVLFRHLQKTLRDNFKKLPHTCKHNAKPKEPQGTFIPRLCMYKAHDLTVWEGKVCDVEVEGGFEQARQCPLWEAQFSKEDLKAKFEEFLAQGRGAVATLYPDAAALMWVLEDDVRLEVVPELAEEEDDPTSNSEESLEEATPPSWIEKLWTKIRVNP